MNNEEIRIAPGDREFHHQLLVDGDAASSLWVVDRSMQIGSAVVRMGGIAGVGTDSKHRNKGYARRVLENSTRWMAENGFDCAVLFGIQDFYDKVGYAVCLPECRFELATRDAEKAERRLAVRPFQPEDVPALRAIYEANNRNRTGIIVRDEATPWFPKGSGWSRRPAAFVFTDGSDIVAYASYDLTDGANAIRDEVIVSEAGAIGPEYFSDILRFAADRAIELRVASIVFLLAPGSLFGCCLTSFGAKQTLYYPRCSGGMGRIIRLRPFLEKTLPEWTRRAEAARDPAVGSALRLETDIGHAVLQWDGHEVSVADTSHTGAVVALPQYRLMQLAMGYVGAEEIAAFADVRAGGDLRLFEVLFPRRLPYMWLADHF